MRQNAPSHAVLQRSLAISASLPGAQAARDAVALPGPGGIAPRKDEAQPAVEEAATQHVSPQEGPARVAERGGQSPAAARRHARRAVLRIAPGLVERIGQRVDRVVHEQPVEDGRGSIMDEALVDHVVAEARPAPPEQAHHAVAQPVTEPQRLPGEARAAPDPEGVGVARRADGRQDGIPQAWRDDLVGIDGEDPVARGKIERAVLLPAETGPVGLHRHAGSGGPRERDGVVGAARVDHDDLVGEVDGAQAALQAVRLVERDEDDRQAGACADVLYVGRLPDGAGGTAHGSAPAGAGGPAEGAGTPAGLDTMATASRSTNARPGDASWKKELNRHATAMLSTRPCATHRDVSSSSRAWRQAAIIRPMKSASPTTPSSIQMYRYSLCGFATGSTGLSSWSNFAA